MSADNWAVCPRCRVRRQARLSEQKVKLDAAYGAVALAEFDQMRSQYQAAEAAEVDATLREDYEIWTEEDGMFTVIYSCGCRECGFGFKFRHDEQQEVGS